MINMKAWESIQDSLKFIEENLPETIKIEELANKAHLSPFYFQRLFSRLTGKPVMEYVKLRRLANAADYLSEHKEKIIDVALKFGFENHETFTRTFKETYRMTPEQFRASPRPLSHFLIPELSLQYYLVDENVPLIADGIILEIRRCTLDKPRFFAGYSIQNPVNDTPGIDLLGELWTKFHEQKGRIENLLPEGNEFGLSSPGKEKGHFTYFAGAETTGPEAFSDFDSTRLNEGTYYVCSFEAENFYLLTTNALNKARDYMFGTWLPHHKLAVLPFMAELYFNTAAGGSFMEIWLQAKED